MSEDDTESSGQKPNRLINCSSPYLRQHAYNPVDWYPWGEEALSRAQAQDKAILLSIGYSACHWCHVMARESFENPDIARQMNESFICVKVDREERPDLDELYMRAVQLMTGGGGWPLTVFLTPQKVPFYGGTYFPPRDRNNLPGFPRVLQSVREAFDERREQIQETAHTITDAIRRSVEPPERGELSHAVIDDAVRILAEQFDLRWAGFGEGAKFPQATALDFLLRAWAAGEGGRPRMMTNATLETMAAGGICDQLGGGIHRYAVDRRWRVPHFEKMLCDNALLAGLYADAYRAFGTEDFKRTAMGTADYVLRELRNQDGAFGTAQDADAEGEEGRYYVWTWEQILDAVGKASGPLVARYFGATQEGNWERGVNVLYRPLALPRAAERMDMAQEELETMVAEGRQALLARRGERQAPSTDGKVLTDWNALMASGLLRVWRATHDPVYLDAGRDAVLYVLEAMRRDGKLLHVRRAEREHVPGFLADYAFLATAALDLYEATLEPRHLHVARELAEETVERFWSEEQGWFVDAMGQELFLPVHNISDQPVPSGTSVMCELLLRLADLSGNEDYRVPVDRVLEDYCEYMKATPTATGALLSAALRRLSAPQELVLSGTDLSGAEQLAQVADEHYLPHMVRLGVATVDAEDMARETPLLEGRMPSNQPTAYVCSAGACREPARQPQELRSQLAELLPDS